MGANRKVTVELPADLLRRAQQSSGEGVTSTIRRGLELIAAILRQIPLLQISEGYWDRAGQLRSKVISHKRRARLADS